MCCCDGMKTNQHMHQSNDNHERDAATAYDPIAYLCRTTASNTNLFLCHTACHYMHHCMSPRASDIPLINIYVHPHAAKRAENVVDTAN